MYWPSSISVITLSRSVSSTSVSRQASRGGQSRQAPDTHRGRCQERLTETGSISLAIRSSEDLKGLVGVSCYAPTSQMATTRVPVLSFGTSIFLPTKPLRAFRAGVPHFFHPSVPALEPLSRFRVLELLCFHSVQGVGIMGRKTRVEQDWQDEASVAKAAAEKLPHVKERDALTREARQLNTASNMSEWLSSAELKSPQ